MKVQSATIDLYGDFKLEQKKTVDERLKVWADGQSRDANISAENPRDNLVLSTEILAKLQREADKTAEAAKPEELVYELSAKERELINLLERFLSRLTGKNVKISVPEKIILSDAAQISLQLTGDRRVDLRNEGQGWGLDYHYRETYSEQETMTFSAEGKIQTEDGRAINFTIAMEMSREFFSSQSLNIKAGEALIDPLIVNYGGGTPQLSDSRVEFDLDGDGEKDSIAVLEKGSGFLALDKNEDGIINDGTELFGPSNGDGFRELAEHDEDKNGWIDENDSVFRKLRIWLKDSNDKEQLIVLGELGIGAIYLGNVGTSFSFKDRNNHQLGQIQQTGVFLKENGQAGTIQHIDLAV